MPDAGEVVVAVVERQQGRTHHQAVFPALAPEVETRHLPRHVGGIDVAGHDHVDQALGVGGFADDHPSCGNLVLELPRGEAPHEA
ncbi:hypothetical protein D3C72_1607220 [compost metagenome]